MDNDGYIFTEPNSTKTDMKEFLQQVMLQKINRQAVTAAGMVV